MSTAVSEHREAPKAVTIRERLNSPDLAAQLARVLPQHLSAERMCRVALTALTRTPKLAECEQASFFQCLLNLSQWGLEPDGRRAHLIPFENRKRGVTECQLIIDYKGIVELVFRSGNARAVHADVVRTGDEFEYSCGAVTKHTPWYLRPRGSRPEKPGEVFAAYCIVQLKDGMQKHEVMSVEEIEGIRKRSKAGGNGPWVTDWNEMAKKTVFRRCSKWLPWSAEIVDAFDKDDDVIEVETRKANADAMRIPSASLESLTAQYGDDGEEVSEQAEETNDGANNDVRETTTNNVEQTGGAPADAWAVDWLNMVGEANTNIELDGVEKIVKDAKSLTDDRKLYLVGEINKRRKALK